MPSSNRPSRRQFLGTSLAGGAALALGGARSLAATPLRQSGAASAKKKILILGGTAFIGPKTIESALARGHSVTVFNRGKTEKRIPFEFKDVEHLYGNRDPNLPADDAKGPDGKLLNPDASPKGLEQLEGRKFDVVIDNSGFYPRLVKASAELLAKNGCGQYVYISSISVYPHHRQSGANEDYELAKLDDPTVENMGQNYANYGGLKVLCEQAAQAAFPGRTAVVRPGYIVGPGDLSDRFSYWPLRIQRGGDVLCPGSPDDPMQWIDVRDLGEWLVKLAEDGTSGVFNAVTNPAKWGDVLAACAKHAKSPVKLVWVDGEFLEKNSAGGEDGPFPIWVNPKGDYVGFHTWSNDRAEKAGLKFRTIDDTVAAILAWFPSEVERRKRVTKQLQDDAVAKGQPPPNLPDPEKVKAGPPPEREQALLAAWQARGT